MMLPNVIKEADHIVYLPRLSSHILAGYTHGLKSSVGWLRDDSRNHLHLDAASFYEKYTEVNYADEIRDRFRMIITLAEKMLLDLGPDDGTVHPVDPMIAIASQNLAHHDALSVAIQLHIDQVVEPDTTLSYSAGLANTVNKAFVTTLVESRTGLEWGPGAAEDYTDLEAHPFEQGLSSDRGLARAWQIEGGAPSDIPVLVVGEHPDSALAEYIVGHSGGILNLS